MESDPLNRFYEPRTARDWQGIQKLREELLKTRGQWIFRGQSDACWSLVTTLDRAAGLHRAGGPLTFPRNRIRSLERGILRTFKRRGMQYLEKTPDDDLDGFAHSLKHMMLALPDMLVPDTFWPKDSDEPYGTV
jgi:hypothetical protein